MFEENMFLTKEEVVRLTGTTHKLKQKKYFEDRGIPVEYDREGRPIPLRTYIYKRYDKNRHHISIEPNFDAI